MDCRLYAYVFLGSLIAGCGLQPNEPNRFTVSGTVTFRGAPVPAGMVRFSPDTNKGNHGPGAIAEIKDGRFSTSPEKGAISGQMIVFIEGYDGISQSNNPDFRDLGKMLFDTYKEEIVIPESDTELAIVVPERPGRRSSPP